MKREEYNIKYVLTISVVAALGGLLFGYDWVVIGGAKPFYEQYFGIAKSPSLQGWAVSCALVGCILGTIVSGVLSKKFGRKKLLIISSVLFFLSAIGTGLVNDFNSFVVFRIIGGIGIGVASNLSPVYIAEVAPSKYRGRLVSLNQLTIVVGILLAQIINLLIAEPVETETLSAGLETWNVQQAWRWMFWAEGVPAALFFFLMWIVPDSPRWLYLKGNEVKANGILAKVGGKTYAHQTIKEIKDSFLSKGTDSSFKSLLAKNTFPIVLLGIVLACIQQWCGINVIFLYAEEVFSAAGYNISGMLFNVVLTGSVNLVFTLLAMALVDKLGRKKLLLIGFGGLSGIYLVIGILYFNGVTGLSLVILIMVAIACYAMTLAPVTWVVLSEIFPNKIRGSAMAAATFSLWLSNTLLAYFFPIINKAINSYGSFWLFGVICIAGFFFILSKVKETKGKTLEEIEQAFDTNQ